MASTLLFVGCAADPKVDRTSLRLAKIETRLGVIEHELDKIHDYLDQNHTAVKVRIENLRKSHETIKIQVDEHDKTINEWKGQQQ